MANAINSPHAGQTIAYNGVQFGGSDAKYDCSPPEFSLNGEPVYDQSGRTVIAIRYSLNVRSTFYENTESAQAANMSAVRRLLSEPGKTLALTGLGIFNGAIVDIDNGPKPQPISIMPLGGLADAVNWTVSFTVAPCSTAISLGSPPWMAFNFEQTWLNDGEGVTTRTISGHVELPAIAGALVPIDRVRDQLRILIPEGFKRTQNVWHETADKKRIEFVVVDMQISGEIYPPGITAADGTVNFATGNGEGAFPNSSVQMSASYQTAPGVPRGLAGATFFAAATSKHRQMIAGVGKRASCIITGLQIRNGKYDSARRTDCSISWVLHGCLSTMLEAAGIWEPITPGNYTAWRASVEKLWGNRGSLQIGSIASDDVRINVCSGVSQATIGQATQSSLAASQMRAAFDGTCGDIPSDGGWIGYDLKVTILRRDEMTLHKKALAYLLKPPILSQDPSALPGPEYAQSPSDEHTHETHGLPEVYVAMHFKGMRIQHEPTVPQLTSVGTRRATPFQNLSIVEAPRVVFRLLSCPVLYRRAVVVYSLSGPVEALQSQSNANKANCFSAINTSGQV